MSISIIIPDNVPTTDLRLALAKTLRGVRVCRQAIAMAKRHRDLAMLRAGKAALSRWEARANAWRDALHRREGLAA